MRAISILWQCAPVNPESCKKYLHKEWKNAEGLAEDVRYYGKWMRDEADKRIGHLYPKVQLPKEYGGSDATVIAWIWARTVICPNPACGARMPLLHSFALSTKKGRETWVEPVVDRVTKVLHFEVRHGVGAPVGTVNRLGAKCIVCGISVPVDHLRTEGQAGRMDAQLMAIVAEGKGGRLYLSPSKEHETITKEVKSDREFETELSTHPQYMAAPRYGLRRHRDLFTSRQLIALTTFSDLVGEAYAVVLADSNDKVTLSLDRLCPWFGIMSKLILLQMLVVTYKVQFNRYVKFWINSYWACLAQPSNLMPQ